MSSEPSASAVGKLESRMMFTALRQLSGQRSTGPSGVEPQSKSLNRVDISPRTADGCEEVNNGRITSQCTVARKDKLMLSGPQANRCCAALRLGDGEPGVALQRQLGRAPRGRARTGSVNVPR